MRPPSPPPALVFVLIFAGIFLLHAPLLQLPYFWDEAGYYVPAARDLLFTGSLIPHTTVSNAHPPLVMAWVALWWKGVGYAPLVTRSAMLVIAAFSLTGLFRLAQRAANTQVAVASTVCTALYPVFFAQSSLAHVDLAAAGLTFWALCAYLEGRPRSVALWFSLAVLAKETAILAPMALAAWEFSVLLCVLSGQRNSRPKGESGAFPRFFVPRSAFGWRSPLSAAIRESKSPGASSPEVPSSTSGSLLESASRRILPLVFPILPLALWYTYHYFHTGFVFGNPEFFRYNVEATLNPMRILLALGLRLWQTFGYLHLWVLTIAMLLAMFLRPLKDAGIERERIATPVQMVFLVIVAAYGVTMAIIGGAVLARYMLPPVPLVIILAVSTLQRRLRFWTVAVAVVALAFVGAWFWNPPYGFSPEDNLAYRDYIVLHEHAERFLEARYPMVHALTAWPASDELARPWLGYITRPVKVVRIEDFSLDEVLSAAEFRQNFEVALVFSTKYEPPRPLTARWHVWEEWKRRFFGYHRDLPPALAARIFGGHIVYSEERKGQWIAVIELERNEILNALGCMGSLTFSNGNSAGNCPLVETNRIPVPR